MTLFSRHPILVTGGAGGIGRAICERLAAEGATVGVLDTNREVAEALVDILRGEGGQAHACIADITDFEAVVAAVDGFEAAAGAALYGLVNNAGWDRAERFVDTTPEFRERVININLHGPLNVTQIALGRMLEAGIGRIVTIASDAGRVGSSGEAVYSAAKGGMIAFMKTLARETARKGVTCNSVCPGPTDTPLLAALDPSGEGKLVKALERAIPMGRLAQPADYPGLVAYFLSEEAGFVTGQTISVSGGLTMAG